MKRYLILSMGAMIVFANEPAIPPEMKLLIDGALWCCGSSLLAIIIILISLRNQPGARRDLLVLSNLLRQSLRLPQDYFWQFWQISRDSFIRLECCFKINLEMQKQKKERQGLKAKPRINTDGVYQWGEQDFQQLYPEPPPITTSSTFFIVALNYRGTLLKVKLPTGIQTKNLAYIFHQEIYRYLLNMRDSNPLLKTAQVVGFESIDQDVLLDYQISIGQGVLSRKTSFNCIEYIAEGRLKRYKVCKCLAIGGFSKVYLVRSLRDGQFYAMKVMLKRFISQNQKESIIQNEKAIMEMLNHPFIVKLNHCFETHNFVCFVLDYCPGGELFYYLKTVKRMSEDDAKFYFIEILYGLMYLHQQNIIYRDLKPENLLINHDGHVKIADFGLSKFGLEAREVTYSFCGSTEYMPPEMIQKTGHSYGVDFYTLGALLYELVTGLPPFYSRNQEEIKDAIVNDELTFPDHVELSSQIKNLLSGLLHKNPKMRIGSLKGLKQIIFHPWIGRINSESVLSKKMRPPHIPTNDQFNFDQNELGDDEQEFTEALMSEHLIPASKEKLFFRNFEFTNESMLKPQIRQIYEVYKQVKRPLQSYSSAKSLKKSSSKRNLKRQSSSPYIQVELNHTSHTKISRSKSPKRKNKSIDTIKLKNNNMSQIGIRSKFGTSFESVKKSTGDAFTPMRPYKKDKENKQSQFLKKKKLVYAYLKA